MNREAICLCWCNTSRVMWKWHCLSFLFLNKLLLLKGCDVTPPSILYVYLLTWLYAILYIDSLNAQFVFFQSTFGRCRKRVRHSDDKSIETDQKKIVCISSHVHVIRPFFIIFIYIFFISSSAYRNTLLEKDLSNCTPLDSWLLASNSCQQFCYKVRIDFISTSNVRGLTMHL